MKPLRNRLTAFCLLVAAVILGCGSAPVTTDPGRPLAMDAITLDYIGREALSKYGYDEIIESESASVQMFLEQKHSGRSESTSVAWLGKLKWRLPRVVAVT